MRHAALGLLLLTSCATAQQQALHLAPCDIAGAQARCGTFDVRESPGSARILPLKLVVLPATVRNETPIFIFGGGPGVPTVPAAEDEVKFDAVGRRLHDLVFVDTRGVGDSAPLGCPNAIKTHEAEMLGGELYPPALIAACRLEAEKNADLTRYTFDYVADDMESLRRALRYGPIDAIGISYGTREALTYYAKYPDSVHAMLLIGPLPPENHMPANTWADTQPVIDRIARDAAVQFPNFREELDRVSASTESGLHVSRGAFNEFLRSSVYTVDQQAEVPLLVHLAAEGNWEPVRKRFAAYRRFFYGSLPLFLSITCPTDVRYIDRNSATSYRAQRQIAACDLWTPGLTPQITIPRTATPILIFAGELDPVTPPRWADVLASDVQNARIVTFANRGHVDGGPCMDKLEVEFFDAGSFDKLDDSCAKSLQRPPFATSLP